MRLTLRGKQSCDAALMLAIAGFVFLGDRSSEEVEAQSGSPKPATPTAHVRSTPENVVLGYFPIDRQPILRVPSGSLVRIDTLSQRGTTQPQNPVEFLGGFGVKPEEILQDV